MASLTVSNLTARITATHTATGPSVTLGTGAAASLAVDKLVNSTLANGTAAGQADRIYAGTRTLAASTTEDLDLAGGLTDAFGSTITFVKVKALLIVAAAANTNNVVVGAASANQWVTRFNSTGTTTLRPGATACYIAGSADATGWTVTASTGDLLKVANSGAGSSVSYDIVIVGTSA